MINDYEDDVAFVMEQLKGWIGNLARDIAAQGEVLEPEVVMDALLGICEEYDTLTDVPDFEGFLESINEEGGTDG